MISILLVPLQNERNKLGNHSRVTSSAILFIYKTINGNSIHAALSYIIYTQQKTWANYCMLSSKTTTMKAYQIPCAIRSSQMALNVGIKDLNSMLGKETFMEMFVILDQSKPRFQQLIICLHIYHVIFVKLKEMKTTTTKILLLN